MQVESFRDTNELANFCANVDVKSVFQETEVQTNHEHGDNGQNFWTVNQYRYVVVYEENAKPVKRELKDVINKILDELNMQNDKIIDLSKRIAKLEGGLHDGSEDDED